MRWILILLLIVHHGVVSVHHVVGALAGVAAGLLAAEACAAHVGAGLTLG